MQTSVHSTESSQWHAHLYLLSRVPCSLAAGASLTNQNAERGKKRVLIQSSQLTSFEIHDSYRFQKCVVGALEQLFLDSLDS